MENSLWNMFINIKNGQLAKRSFILQTKTKICESFLRILWNERFISGYTKSSNKLKVFLRYNRGKPVIDTLKIISKPSRRVYCSAKQIWKLNSSKFCIIFSTNKGLKTVLECKKLRIGGEAFILIK